MLIGFAAVVIISGSIYIYGHGKPCTCYGFKIDIGGEKCVGISTFCGGLMPPIMPTTENCALTVAKPVSKITFEYLIGSLLYGTKIEIIAEAGQTRTTISDKSGGQVNGALTQEEYRNLIDSIDHYLCNLERTNDGPVHSPIYVMKIVSQDGSQTLIHDDGIITVNSEDYTSVDIERQYLPSILFQKILNKH